MTEFAIGPFFTGFVFVVNIIMGTGGLALPIAFCKAGWALGTLLMIFATFSACVTICWHFEAQIRAFALGRAFNLRLISVVSLAPLESEQGAREAGEYDEDEAVAPVNRQSAAEVPAAITEFVARGESQAETPFRMSPRKKKRSKGSVNDVMASSTSDSAALLHAVGDAEIVVAEATTLAEAVHRCGPAGFRLVSRMDDGEEMPAINYDAEVAPGDYLEVGDTLELFWGRYAVWVWNFALLAYVIGTLWSYTTVLAESALIGIPLAGLTHYHECDPFAKPPKMPGNCHTGLRVWVAIFTAMLLVLVMRDWKIMPTLQKIFTTLMYIILTIIVVTCIIGMHTRPYCPENVPSAICDILAANATAPYTADVVAADGGHFGTLFGYGIFAMICHTGSTFMIRRMPNPGLTKPVFRVAYAVVFTVYMFVAYIVAFYIGSEANTIVTVNWAFYAHWGNGSAIQKGVGCFVLFFPILSVTAAYILTLRACSDAAEFLLPVAWRQAICRRFGREYTPFNEPEGFSVWPLQVILRTILWFCGTVFAFASTNTGKALSVTSLFGFFVLFVIPIMVQVGSQRAMASVGISSVTPYDDIFSGRVTTISMGVICVVATVYYCAVVLPASM